MGNSAETRKLRSPQCSERPYEHLARRPAGCQKGLEREVGAGTSRQEAQARGDVDPGSP